MNTQEPILREDKDRFIIFPVKHHDIWEAYKAIEANFWTTEQLKIEQDIPCWNKGLNRTERLFLEQVLSFILYSERDLNGKIAKGLSKKVSYPEAKSFFDFQVAIENTHTEAYSLSLNLLLESNKHLETFKYIEAFPSSAKKKEWLNRWIKNASFAEQLIALSAIKSIFSYSGFAAIFWLKNQGLMPELCYTYEMIYRDKALHRDFAVQLVTHHLIEEISEKKIQQIIGEAVKIEKEVIAKLFTVDLFGLSKKSLFNYLDYEAGRLFSELRTKHLQSENQMTQIQQESLLEKRTKHFKTDKNMNSSKTGEKSVF